MQSLEVKCVASDSVPASISRASAKKSGLLEHHKGIRIQILELPVREGKVTKFAIQDRFQFQAGGDDFVDQLFGVLDLSKIGVSSRVTTNLDAGRIKRQQ